MTRQDAYRELMDAAKGLDSLRYKGGLEPWRQYLRAYFRWLEAA